MNDEQELEARLREAFRRGSLPSAPASLVSSVEEVPEAPVTRVSGREGRTRAGRRPLGVLAVAAVLLVGGAVALSVGTPRPSPVPVPSRSPEANSSPTASTTVRLTFEPQWTAEVPFTADRSSAVAIIIKDRILATGVVGARVATDDAGSIVVDLPAGSDPDAFRRLIGPRGFLEFVTLDGAIVEVGSELDPGSFPALVDSSDVMDASVENDQAGQSSLVLNLREPGSGRFGAYTTAHIGSMFAITLDRVAIAVPVIQSELGNGDVQVTFGSLDSAARTELARLAAIIKLGPLPVALVEVGGEPTPSASPARGALPPIRCETPLPIAGAQLECEAAVQSALGILPAGHPPIAVVTFNHDCHDVIVQAIPDCAVQLSGTVTVTFLDGSPPVRIAVSFGSDPRILPNLPLPDGSAVPMTLNVAPADLGCDAIGMSYRSVVIHVDPAAADPVWAVTDASARLRTFWSAGFTGGTSTDPVVYDSHGVVVARDGTMIDVPDGAWPNLGGYFVCPSTDAIYVLERIQ